MYIPDSTSTTTIPTVPIKPTRPKITPPPTFINDLVGLEDICDLND